MLQELEGLSLREVARLGAHVIQDGDVDALAVWFELHLDQENSISTGPDEDTCWEQAIYPVTSRKTTLNEACEGWKVAMAHGLPCSLPDTF